MKRGTPPPIGDFIARLKKPAGEWIDDSVVARTDASHIFIGPARQTFRPLHVSTMLLKLVLQTYAETVLSWLPLRIPVCFVRQVFAYMQCHSILAKRVAWVICRGEATCARMHGTF